MEIIFLSIGVIADSIAIILLWVSHIRGNRSKGRGMSYADLKRSMELAHKMESINSSGDRLVEHYRKAFGYD